MLTFSLLSTWDHNASYTFAPHPTSKRTEILEVHAKKSEHQVLFSILFQIAMTDKLNLLHLKPRSGKCSSRTRCDFLLTSTFEELGQVYHVQQVHLPKQFRPVGNECFLWRKFWGFSPTKRTQSTQSSEDTPNFRHMFFSKKFILGMSRILRRFTSPAPVGKKDEFHLKKKNIEKIHHFNRHISSRGADFA